MNLPAMEDRYEYLSAELDKALFNLRVHIEAAAEAERRYRRTKARCLAMAPKAMSVTEKSVHADAASADARYARDLAAGEKEVTVHTIFVRRAQMSGLQSLLAGHREEAAFVRTSGGYQP